MPGAVLRGQYRPCHTIQPAPAAVQGLLTEHAFAAQADLLHDPSGGMVVGEAGGLDPAHLQALECDTQEGHGELGDRKSTRLNSSHVAISYAVFCLKKKK